jgi:hypothetical protein
LSAVVAKSDLGKGGMMEQFFTEVKNLFRELRLSFSFLERLQEKLMVAK